MDVHLGDRSDLHGSTNDDNQIDHRDIVLSKSVEEAAGELFAEEGDVRLESQSRVW
jgi:hypothetical protein